MDGQIKRFAAVTIVAHNYLPQARILAKSFRASHPEDDFYIAVVDRPVEILGREDDGVHLIPISRIDFGDEGYEYLASIYDVTEFATCVKPFVLKQLAQKYQCVFYIDPDIKIFSSLNSLIDMTIEFGWSLTPHSDKPIHRNGWQPTEEEIKGAGIYNLGFIGVTKRANAMLEWWCERLKRDCIIDVPRQLFTDQRWIDMAVAIWPAYIERGHSFNVAYWNLDHRKVWREGDTYVVDGDPLKFFHFSGYDPTVPYWISKYQTGRPRVLLSDNSHVAELCAEYGAEMLTIREEISDAAPYGWSEIVPGLRWTKALRRYLRDCIIEAEASGSALPPNPYMKDGPQPFINWLRSVDGDKPIGLPRYLEAVYLYRGDLRYHFPEVLQGDLRRFAKWVYESGAREEEIIRFLGWNLHLEVNSSYMIGEESRICNGVDVVGYLSAELGVGEAGRLLVEGMRSAGVPVAAINYSKTISRQKNSFVVDPACRYSTLIAAVNADQLPVLCRDLAFGVRENRYVIGQWFWELEHLPSHFADSFSLVDELWAPTEFIETMLKRSAPPDVKVRHINLPLREPSHNPSIGRDHFGFEDDYVFLFMFDFLSVFKRKNPLGLIDAYLQAFPTVGRTRLVVKTINGSQRLKELEFLRWRSRGRHDIQIIDEYFESSKNVSLMKAADCYVSLHRSEGLGLTIAEAMILGKPVIATAYGGNMDFMTDATSLAVPWRYVKVGNDAEAYPADEQWAEPDLDFAAEKMREIALSPQLGVEIGVRAVADLQRRFSVSHTGEAMKRRLDEIWSGRYAN